MSSAGAGAGASAPASAGAGADATASASVRADAAGMLAASSSSARAAAAAGMAARGIVLGLSGPADDGRGIPHDGGALQCGVPWVASLVPWRSTPHSACISQPGSATSRPARSPHAAPEGAKSLSGRWTTCTARQHAAEPRATVAEGACERARRAPAAWAHLCSTLAAPVPFELWRSAGAMNAEHHKPRLPGSARRRGRHVEVTPVKHHHTRSPCVHTGTRLCMHFDTKF